MHSRRVWFITGASSGFGKAFATYAATQGYRVVATARTQRNLEELAGKFPGQVLAVPMDVTDRRQIDRAVKQAIDQFGRVDVLINNAGYSIVGAMEETPEDELRALMDTNFFGAVAVTRALLPFFRKQRAGAIVNISSLGGQLSYPGFGAYSASKFALEGVSEALAHEVKPFGVKVLIVEPGQFRTELAGNALKSMPEIEGYGESVGPIREFAQKMHGTQEGDPMKAARAIDHALQAENTPLRLQLGADAVQSIRDHAQHLLTSLEAWRGVAEDTRIAD